MVNGCTRGVDQVERGGAEGSEAELFRSAGGARRVAGGHLAPGPVGGLPYGRFSTQLHMGQLDTV